MNVKLLEVDGESMKRELAWLRDVLTTSYGPWGSYSLLQPVVGGVLTLTRLSKKILQLMRTDNTLIKMVITCLQGHSHRYKDSTLYAGLLTCSISLQGLDLNIPRQRVAMAIDHTLSEVVAWLQGECPVTHKLELGSMKELTGFLCTYLGAKMSMLTHQELIHLGSLLIQGLLRALPSSRITGHIELPQYVHIISLPHHPVSQSRLLEGLLLSEQMYPHSGEWRQLHDGAAGGFRVALFDVSLAGDMTEALRFTGEGESDVGVEEVMVQELIAMGTVLVQRKVTVIACQKCVHPKLRDYFLQEGVFVLERVSSLLLEPLHRLCGGDILSSTSSHTLLHFELGTLSSVSEVTVLGHRYLQVKGLTDTHSTLLLCSEWNEDELQALCHDAMSVLERCVGDATVIAGGGCADTAIANFLRSKVTESVGAKRSVMEKLSWCFEQQALALDHHHGVVLFTDSTRHHCWAFPHNHGSDRTPLQDQTCRCGALTLSSLPPNTTWTSLLPSNQYLLPTFSNTVPQVSREVRSSVFDLLTPRIAAIECVSELSQTILSTAFVISSTNN